ncbi:MAG: DNA polymerase ligase N-terminal domain-containing protein [bacterium]
MSLFVIQEHHSSHLHWDFRFEYDGKLKSWAIPKEPPIEIGVKRLAIQVEDHELSWANFEGVIPEGNYGGGTVKIWDKGECEILQYQPESKIELILHGEKLKGKYILLKLGDDKKGNYLFFKTKS